MRRFFVFNVWDKPKPAFCLAATLANKRNKQGVLEKYFIKWKTDDCRWGWTLSVLQTAALCAQKFLIPPSAPPPKKRHAYFDRRFFPPARIQDPEAAASTKHRKAKAHVFAKRQVSSGTRPVRSSLHLLRLYPASSFLLLLVLFYSRISPRTFFERQLKA